MNLMFLFVLLFTTSVIQCNGGPAGTLKYAAIFIRHGARSPLIAIPALDSYMIWPVGYGELTPMGQRQLYLLGRGFRKLYIEQEKLLSLVYNSTEFAVRSTDYKRTIASADAFLKGFYPDNQAKLNEKQLKDSTIWTPPFHLTIPEEVKTELKDSAIPFDIPIIPITSYNRSYDRLLEFASCPRYEGFWDIYFASDKIKELLNKHKESVKWVCDVLGANFTEVAGEYTFYFLDYLLTAEYHGKLDILSENQKVLKDLTVFFTRILVEVLTMDKWMQAIAVGEFSRYLPKLLKSAIDNTNNGQKAAVFFTHDMTMMQYLMGLGVDPNSEIFEDVPFASNLVLELRENAGEHYVDIIYNGKSLGAKKFEEFEKEMGKIRKLERSWEEECKL